MNPFQVHYPSGKRIPILVSIPHCGTSFPEELINEYNPALIHAPDDTDWFVNQLYDFAPAMGITMITSVYSRWVIDLNRDPQNKPLYTDGRIITSLCPATNFLGEPLYIDNRKSVNDQDVSQRLDNYYWPYHHELIRLISALKSEFGKLLIWDAHSIRQVVRTIREEKFPDLILGDVNLTSASKEIIESAFQNLGKSSYTLKHNDPFIGGFITREYGKPLDDQHALQLEMSKINYMDDTEARYDNFRAEEMRKLLKRTLSTLAELLTNNG